MSNNTTDNPYATPTADVNNNLQVRSAIPKVIGIISLIMAGIGIFGAIAGLAMAAFMPSMLEAQTNLGLSKTYIIGSQVFSLLTSVWAIFIGLKLIKYLDIGRRHFNYYAIVTILFSFVAYFMTKSMMDNMFSDLAPEAASAASSMSSISSLSVFIGPVIVIIVALLLNQQRVKDCLN